MAFVGKLGTMECHINADLVLPAALGGKLRTMECHIIGVLCGGSLKVYHNGL